MATTLVLSERPVAPASAAGAGPVLRAQPGGGAALAPGHTARATWATASLRAIDVRARARGCARAPVLEIRLDGRRAVRTSVRPGAWRRLRADVAVRAGRHRLTARASAPRCARARVKIGWVRGLPATGGPAARPPVAGSVAAASAAPARAERAVAETRPVSPGPQSLYVEPDTHARRQAAAWRATRPADAATMDRLAAQPQAVWLGEWSGDVAGAAGGLTMRAAAAGALPVLVAYNIPQRDCGQWSAGGATRDGYRSWIRALAAGIGTRPALVILEPDALAGMDCLGAQDRAARVALLRDAAGVLGALPATRVYLDAGNAGWHPAAGIAARLRDAGIDAADGFALNVSNFGGDDAQIAYGRAIAAGVGGRPFVVDTSRNGLGPFGHWCNPPGRALGRPPQLTPGVSGIDAFLWIKRPGESDGACNGGPAAGTWWPEEALGLARRAGW